MTRRELVNHFKRLHPDLYKDGMIVTEIDSNSVLIKNPSPKGEKYVFKYIPPNTNTAEGFELKWIMDRRKRGIL